VKNVLLLFVVGALLALAGCIDYQETITLTIMIRYALDKTYLDEAEQFEDSVEAESYDESDEIPSEADIREQIETTNSNVKLISFEETETDKWRIWNMKFSFEKLSDFDQLEEALAGEEESGSGEGPERSYVKQPDGTWLFTHSMGGSEDTEGFQFDEYDQEMDAPSDSESAEAKRQMQEAMSEYSDESEEDEDSEEMTDADSAMSEFAESMQMMLSGAAEAKMTLTVQFPSRIVESNATRVEENTAVWEASLYDTPPKMTAKVKP